MALLDSARPLDKTSDSRSGSVSIQKTSPPEGGNKGGMWDDSYDGAQNGPNKYEGANMNQVTEGMQKNQATRDAQQKAINKQRGDTNSYVRPDQYAAPEKALPDDTAAMRDTPSDTVPERELTPSEVEEKNQRAKRIESHRFKDLLGQRDKMLDAVNVYKFNLERMKNKSLAVEERIGNAGKIMDDTQGEINEINTDMGHARRAVHSETRSRALESVTPFATYNRMGVYGKDNETKLEWVPRVGKWTIFERLLNDAKQKASQPV